MRWRAPGRDDRTIDRVRSARVMVSTCVGAIAFALLVGAPRVGAERAVSLVRPSPAPATDQQRLAAYNEALSALTQELAYIVLLGWGEEPVPTAAREMPGAIGIERSQESVMIDELRSLDGQSGPQALARLEAIGEPITPAIDLVLSRNVPLDQPGVPQIGTAIYVKAYDQLLIPWSALMGLPATGPAPTGAPSATVLTSIEPTRPTTLVPAAATQGATTPGARSNVPTTVASAISAVGTAEGVGGDSTGTGATSGLMIVLVIVLAVVVIVWTLVSALSRRRRRSTHARATLGDDVLDAGRTIMAAVELDEFLRAVAEQIARLVGAEAAVVVDGCSWTPPNRDLPSDGVLDRAVATGRSVRADGATVVPIVASGRVLGVLVSWSPQPQTEETLGTFAPLVGAALEGVRSRIEHEHLAFDDGLTGVGNRRRFDRDLDRFIGAGGDRRMPVALAMVDVDHFKLFNDTHGHQTGDAVLRHVAAVIAAHVRAGDLVYRYGGEEFAVLLPDAELVDAIEVVERVRSAIAASPLPGPAYASVPAVTVSVGVSATPPIDSSAMVRSADEALYAAKAAGRNRVEAITVS